MKNFLVFPMKYLNITQGYDGTISHKPHLPQDYAYDLGGYDSGRDWFYCPCDEVKVMHCYGFNNSNKTNTIWIQSTSKVVFADGTSDYVTMQCTHMNDDEAKLVPEGKTFKRGEKMFREGIDGAHSNHVHLSIRKGKYVAPGWAQNKNGKWCCISTGEAVKIEKAMYLKSDTIIKNTKGYKFTECPKAYKVLAAVAVVRKSASKTADKVGTVSMDDIVYSTQQKGSWIKIGSGRWVYKGHLEEIVL